MEVVAQSGAADRDLTLVGRAEPWLDKDPRSEAQHVIQDRLTSASRLRWADDRDCPRHFVRPLSRLVEIRARPDDGNRTERRRIHPEDDIEPGRRPGGHAHLL